MLNLTKEQQYILATATFSIMLCVIFYMYAYTPLSKKIRTLEETLTQKREELEKGKIIASKIDVLKREYDRLKMELSYIEERLPRKEEMPNLLKQVTRIGKDSEVDFVTFKPLNIKKEDDYEILPIEVNIEGTYHKLGKFVSEIGNLPRIITPKIKEITAYTETSEEEIKASQEPAVDRALKGDMNKEGEEMPKIKKSPYTLTAKLMMKTYIFKEKEIQTKEEEKEDEEEGVSPETSEESGEEEYF